MASNSSTVDNNNNIIRPQQEDEDEDEESMMMIPVVKNKEILKKIIMAKKEEVMLFGRHPDCDVLLRNPSVTESNWLNGRRVDALKIGASTRLYILSWMTPPQPALHPHTPSFFDYDQQLDIAKDQSFPSEQIQPILLQKHTIPVQVLNAHSVTETSHSVTKFDSGNDRPCHCRNRVLSPPCLQSVDNTEKIEACPEAEMAVETNLFCTLSEYLTHNICLPVVRAVQRTKMQQFQGSSSLLKNPDPASFDENGAAADSVIMPKQSEFGCSLRDDTSAEGISTDGDRIFNSDENTSLPVGEVTLDSELQQIEVTQDIAVDSISEGVTFNVKDLGNQCTCIKSVDPVFDEKGVASVNVMPKESENLCTLRENDKIEDILTVEARISNPENTSLQESVAATKSQQIEIADEVTVDSISDGEKQGICLIEEFQSNLQTVSAVASGEENQTSQSLVPAAKSSEMETFEGCVKATDKSSSSFDVCLRRGKAASSPQVRTRMSRFMSTSNVDTEVVMSSEKDMMNKSIPKDLFSVLDDEEKVFTSNKENFSANMLHSRLMRKKSKPEEIKHSKSQRSHNSEANFSPNIYSSDERISSFSNKENQAPKVVQEWKPQRNSAEKQYTTESKKNRVERVPFQPLTNSGGKHKSGTSGSVAAAKSIDARNCGQILEKHTKPSRISGEEQKRSWDMVVDTASLLNKESRKALQLLQGLKGTRLIIPRLVIRELESMKQQFRFFRRNSEASSALEWIEDCMVSKKSWIRIQSAVDEIKLNASTPLASPQTRFIEELASPTIVDHILNCALLYRRKESNRQLILLSGDISLKIEAMAEGLLCETVPEFRLSLVNPFSDRFMWASSTPRGLTWSCQDDVVLREKYCSLPSQAGLKLVTEQFLY